MTRRFPPPIGLVLLAACLGALLLGAARPKSSAERGRVVVLGFDGADGRTVEELLKERPGQYPNFERLAREGTFGRLESVAPPESPVSWAALNTGQNPAKTGVPGFVKRNLSPGPGPTFGHALKEEKPLESFENTPIPTYGPVKLAALSGAAAFAFFLLVFLVLLRLRPALGALLALLLGAVGGWCGYTVRGLLADEYPRYSNPNRARNFWDYLADEGVPAVVLDAPQVFDMPSAARVLAGLGVPDAKNGLGEWCIYTTSDAVFQEVESGGKDTGTAGTLYKVYERDGLIETRLPGPKNFWAEEKLKQKRDRLKDRQSNDPSLDYATSQKIIDELRETEGKLDEVEREGTFLPLSIELGEGRATVRIGGQEQEVAVGEWSDYYHLTFELNWLLKVHAITRVKLVQLEPHVELFVNVLDIDPEKPPFWQAISTPFAFSAELAHENGPFETYGWPTATMPFKDGVVSPELMLEDVEFTTRWQEKLIYSTLARDDWQVFMGVISTTDRVQHMMYQYYDEGHPLYDATEAAKTFPFFGETVSRREAIPAIYKQMDRILGVVMDQHLGPDDTLLVCSDHGFQSFRHQVNVNNWLAEQGYLKVKQPLKGKSGTLAFVDWSGTRAYSMGMGFIYLNLKGREPEGIVEPAQADALLAEIKASLLAYEDEKTGLKVCKEAYIVKEIHAGPFLDQEADLICGFAPTYRVSWASTTGGLSTAADADGVTVQGPVITASDKNWSGDHVSVALSEVEGVFFSNRKVDVPEGGFHALHLAPTALALAGVPVPAEMDMSPLTVR